ncbi:phospho-sugar mutase [Microlunatus sp. Gsoil 973]|uniref:phospho-sugar mutase n=1 Tax=Microlunatus sp. Gsoil 973 TaxID=2672569 RepID=UPI0012B4AFFB|nr:phospho-sugar mutase [Microlunatus sp. Gsoil 973]QGN35191.1 phospho-sugar mutase [Microlunatus sp. Gsoil 973]
MIDPARWRAEDPDPATAAELDDLLRRSAGGDAAAEAELTDAFSGRLQFGTAGLRGPLGPGPNRMNRVTVGQAAAGLARYLVDHELSGGTVIIGYDGRHNSEVFARDSAEILAGAGFRPLLIEHPLPTPVVAFGISHFDCVAGIVVTASHNPAQDNGYKVYLGDGSQIVPPVDGEIAAHIDTVASGRPADLKRSGDYDRIGEQLITAYLRRATELVSRHGPREVDWVYTPMHGVGRKIVEELVSRTGFSAPHVVAAQADPDPDFPTVPFPNPEEPGALDLAIELAGRQESDLVIANDPDADRCAVAVPDRNGTGWRMLRGDELGALLADDALRRGVPGTYACSIVSSSLLQAMAKDHDHPFRFTLTGFKWIGRVPDLAFGYEEAIGYCVDPAAVPDKDGITALLRVLDLAGSLRAGGRTLSDRLDEIAERYGVYATDQLTVRVEDPSLITDAMSRLRSDPPTVLAGEPVEVRDLADGVDLGDAGVLPPTDGVLITGRSIKVVARPSGTEPKLKCYLEARVPTSARRASEAHPVAADLLRSLRTEMAAALGVTA